MIEPSGTLATPQRPAFRSLLRAATSAPPTFVRCLSLCLLLSFTPASARALGVLSLEDAIAIAAQHSFDLLGADERLLQAELNVDRAWALLKPNLSANFNYTHVEPRPASTFAIPAIFDISRVAEPCGLSEGSTGNLIDPACRDAFRAELTRVQNAPKTTFDFAGADTASFRATLSWNILNGRAIPLLTNAKASADVERLKQKNQARLLRLQVTRAFYAVEAAQRTISVAERGKARTQARVAMAEERASVGEQPPAALRLERLSRQQADIDVLRAKNAVLQSLFALSFALGIDEPIEGVRPPPPPERPTGTSTAGFVKMAKETRDDVLIATAAVDIAERTMTDAWWKFAPTIGLFGAFRYSNIAGLSGQNEEWSLGLNANWLLYDGGVRYADLHEAESNIRLAKASLERTLTLVAQDVERSLLGLETKAIALDRAEVLSTIATERADLTRTQQNAGSAREIEVAEAMDAEKDAEIGVITAKLERDMAILELRYALGL